MAQVAAMQAQQATLIGEVARLSTENQVLRQEQAQPTRAEHLMEALGQAVTALQAVRTGATQSQSLVDLKGLGKPPVFKNESARFTEWLRKTSGFLVAAYGASFRQVLEWIEDQDGPVTREDLHAQFGELSSDPVQDLSEKDAQVHVALLSLTEGESFDVVMGAAPHGLEALRRLVRRWDPLSGGKRRALLRQILVPERARFADLASALEKWEELVRRYEKRRAGGVTQVLDDDIKTAALEALVPAELEQHLAMNRTRLSTYEAVRGEIQSFIEARRSQAALKTSQAGKKDPDAMEVDSLMKKGKGKGTKGKQSAPSSRSGPSQKPSASAQPRTGEKARSPQIECWNCGKKGHRSAECWSAAGSSAAKASSGKGRGGGTEKKTKGRGKNPRFANALDEQPQGEPESASALELSAVDVQSLQGTPHLDPDGWLSFTYDTGAAVTAFPLDMEIGESEAPSEASYKTASGEIIQDRGGIRLVGTTENEELVQLNGRRTDVHKVLLSAGKVHAKGHLAVLGKGGGYIVPAGSDLAGLLREVVAQHACRTPGVVPLHEERGTYVGYMKVESDAGGPAPAQKGRVRQQSSRSLCPLVPGGAGAPSSSGGRRQPCA